MEPHLRLRAWRESLGISKAAAGRRIGCSAGMVSMIEHGRRGAGLRVALAIEEATREWPDGPIGASEWVLSVDIVSDDSADTDVTPAPTGTED